ncbi:amidohydrolase [Sulfitobacter sp. SK012]|uniref:M20 aminoacylase family protein n=1 Tax=Sulfitobacter sp. SK012 TaxID=1389005 RepID=UPI000E0AABCF|nr:M20 aminoacylase family protein [Sulfitobacter sp. SK012]AXI46238.1 amidohydrolase [Sulfitobacter sp. SK012]
MPVINRIADFATDMTAWRRHLHTIPELGFDCPKTAAFIKERLVEMGVDEIHEGIAQTGIVAIINGTGAGRTVGLRADFDALPIEEETGVEYASTHAGKMHACGHDGHTAMLLGAAKYMVETRNFAGRVALIFQPAEEDGGGAQVMCAEGMMDRFDIAEAYGIHNLPGAEEGMFFTTAGPIMAAVDTVTIYINGRGGHGAMPHEAADPVVAACGVVQAIQTIVSRNTKSGAEKVISVTQIHTGSASNIIPDTAMINATVRTFDVETRALIRKRLEEIVQGQAASYGVTATMDYEEGYPSTVNTPEQTAYAAGVARSVVGADKVDENFPKVAGSEDFAYMLEERPGAYLFLGAGPGAGLHHPKFNFNDEIAPVGASFFVQLVEQMQPAAS